MKIKLYFKHKAYIGVLGATLTEAALVICLVALMAFPAVARLGKNSADKFCQVDATLDSKNKDSPMLHNLSSVTLCCTPEGWDCLPPGGCDDVNATYCDPGAFEPGGPNGEPE